MNGGANDSRKANMVNAATTFKNFQFDFDLGVSSGSSIGGGGGRLGTAGGSLKDQKLGGGLSEQNGAKRCRAIQNDPLQALSVLRMGAGGQQEILEAP
ncbi:unnamed protein product [Closterium sp. NIES-53]